MYLGQSHVMSMILRESIAENVWLYSARGYMLEARPGAMIWVGNGDSAGLHHPAYNFNDEVIPVGTSYWVRLIEKSMAV